MAPKRGLGAKAKVAPRVRGLRRPARAGGDGVMRRPAGVEAPGAEEVAEKWNRGEIVELGKLDLGRLVDAGPLVVEEGSYYQQACRVAGKCLGVIFEEGRSYLRLSLTGTLNESLLKHMTGNPDSTMKGHVCHSDCNQEEVADNVMHITKARRMKREADEEAWVKNLEKVAPMIQEDELEPLRRMMPGREPGDRDAEREKKKDKKADRESRSREKRKKAKKASRRDKKKKRSSKSGCSDSREKAKTDGTQPKKACQKDSQNLFQGTGLDSRERIRNRVARRARRHLRKRSEKSSSGSKGSASSGSSRSGDTGAEEGLFEAGSKVRVLAEGYPGALTTHALNQMRTTLIHELGHQDRPNSLQAVSVPYCRQHLLKKASGPVQRELLTLTHSLDLLVRGKPASCADTLIQRVKSIEQTLLGSHWSVAQHLEVLPQETASITDLPEARSARREVYDEARLRWLSTNQDGRPSAKGGKGGGRAQGKDGKGQDREAKGGKKGGGKGDSAKKKES